MPAWPYDKSPKDVDEVDPFALAEGDQIFVGHELPYNVTVISMGELNGPIRSAKVTRPGSEWATLYQDRGKLKVGAWYPFRNWSLCDIHHLCIINAEEYEFQKLMVSELKSFDMVKIDTADGLFILRVIYTYHNSVTVSLNSPGTKHRRQESLPRASSISIGSDSIVTYFSEPIVMHDIKKITVTPAYRLPPPPNRVTFDMGKIC